MSTPDDAAHDDASFDEVRAAASDVIASLKKLIEATERVVQDPETFSQIVDGGRSVVEAFVGGFTAPTETDEANETDETAAPPTRPETPGSES
ncbi:MAG: hypothetical protein R2707_05020 [Acidimicrobiales bacterium]